MLPLFVPHACIHLARGNQDCIHRQIYIVDECVVIVVVAERDDLPVLSGSAIYFDDMCALRSTSFAATNVAGWIQIRFRSGVGEVIEHACAPMVHPSLACTDALPGLVALAYVGRARNVADPIVRVEIRRSICHGGSSLGVDSWRLTCGSPDPRCLRGPSEAGCSLNYLFLFFLTPGILDFAFVL